MEFFKKSTSIDFMALRKWTAALSCLLFIGSIGSLMINGLNWGLDFSGGIQIQVVYTQPANLATIRQDLSQAGLDKAVVQSYGTAKDVLVSLPPEAGSNNQQLTQAVLKAMPGAQLQRQEFVGPEVGAELANKGALAFIIALLATMTYIAIRFEWRFAVSAAIALIHDPILILGVFSLAHIEFNLTALAAVLAVIGYSLNDTIVIYDRVRENFRKVRQTSSLDIMNLSINQTLSRTIMTSAATLVVVLMLLIFGGAMIHGFALALVIGIAVGTYSSIYVAGALAVALGLKRSDLLPRAKTAIDELP
jgi:preprotein translocase subunit SecF